MQHLQLQILVGIRDHFARNFEPGGDNSFEKLIVCISAGGVAHLALLFGQSNDIFSRTKGGPSHWSVRVATWSLHDKQILASKPRQVLGPTNDIDLWTYATEFRRTMTVIQKLFITA